MLDDISIEAKSTKRKWDADDSQDMQYAAYMEVLYRCRLCISLPCILTTKQSFSEHVKSSHLEKNSKNTKCNICDLFFDTPFDVSHHTNLIHKTSTPVTIERQIESNTQDSMNPQCKNSLKMDSTYIRNTHVCSQHNAGFDLLNGIQGESHTQAKCKDDSSVSDRKDINDELIKCDDQYLKIDNYGGNIEYVCTICAIKKSSYELYMVHTQSIQHKTNVTLLQDKRNDICNAEKPQLCLKNRGKLEVDCRTELQKTLDYIMEESAKSARQTHMDENITPAYSYTSETSQNNKGPVFISSYIPYVCGMRPTSMCQKEHNSDVAKNVYLTKGNPVPQYSYKKNKVQKELQLLTSTIDRSNAKHCSKSSSGYVSSNHNNRNNSQFAKYANYEKAKQSDYSVLCLQSSLNSNLTSKPTQTDPTNSNIMFLDSPPLFKTRHNSPTSKLEASVKEYNDLSSTSGTETLSYKDLDLISFKSALDTAFERVNTPLDFSTHQEHTANLVF